MQSGLQQSLSKSDNQFILPFSFIISSFFFLIIFSVMFILYPSSFSPEMVRGPHGIALSHLFILGWMTTLVMGAIYQLISVITQKNIHSKKAGFTHFFLHFIGVTGLLISIPAFNLEGMMVFGAMTIVGVLIFIINVFMTIIRSELNNQVIFATKSSLIYLGLTVVSGLIMVVNFRFGIIGFHQSLLVSHLWFGLIGFFLFLIVGYSFKMLPMFYLSHGFSEKWQKWCLLSLHIAIIAGAFTAFFSKATAFLPVSLFFLTVGIIFFILQIKEVQQKKFKKNPGKGIRFFVLLVYVFMAVSVVFFIVSVINSSLIVNLNVLTPAIFFFLFGFVSMSILAYLSKIIPFLWWTFRYGKSVGEVETPSLADMIDETIVLQKLWLQFIALLLFIVSLVVGATLFIQLTAILFAGSILYYLVTIAKTFTY
ncbi:hypothetical protein LGQ02_16615 [Bacillus shivajii]|uniref:hypothetical protein n=1 Tax=Bacillus shivajii TaxID=1983719 RepID=UPI001CFA5D36|nr:hypothetical protein [Bacillus shivajii]UCZ52445.1 hypothetical protein LGQ02_16615 [Bacillus shivajii]